MDNSESKLAIIDIGSNTIRLVIYVKNGAGKFKEKENIKSTARLRHYLNNKGFLEEPGINLLVKILNGYKKIIDFHKVQAVNVVGTAAIRQAENQLEVMAIVKEQTGFSVKVLSEQEEAFYGFFAVTHTTSLDEGVTIDLGGGSTEITYFQNRELMYSHSFPFGVVSLKEQFIKGEKISEKEKEELYHYIMESYQSLPWLKGLQVPIIAIGGSARNIAQMDQNLKKYPLSGIHQYILPPEDIKHLLHTVEMLNASQLKRFEGLAKDRADIILPALEVFVQLCEYVKSPKFMFSRKGLRDGILLKDHDKGERIIDKYRIVESNIKELVQVYGISTKHSEHVAHLAQQLYTQLDSVYQIKLACHIKKMIDYSAHVYNLGHYIDSDESSQHTFYLLANNSIDGLEHKERLQLALIASFKSKALLKQYCNPFIEWFSSQELREIRIAGALTKFASALDASKRGIVKSIAIVTAANKEQLNFLIDCKGDAFVEKYQAEKQVRHLEKAINKNIQLVFRD